MSTVEQVKNASNRSRRFKFVDAVLTDVGRRRNENQDAYGIAHTDELSLFIVADGMGGARGGATASSLAVNVVGRESFDSSGNLNAATLKTAIEYSNSVIFNKSKTDEDLAGMGTTIVALAFVGSQCVVAHVGDSRIYRLRGTELEQLTRDHTLVQELVDTGAIPPEEAADHPIAHMLTRSLGPAESVEVEIRVLPDLCEADDQFLLCSDGLYNLVTDEEIQEQLVTNDPETAAKELVDLALERGGTDNVTVEILRLADITDPAIEAVFPDGNQPELTLSEPHNLENLDEMIAAVRAPAEPAPAEDATEDENLEQAAQVDSKVADSEAADEKESIEESESVSDSGEAEEESVSLDSKELSQLAAKAGGKEFRLLQLSAGIIGLFALGAVAYIFLNLETSPITQVASGKFASGKLASGPSSGSESMPDSQRDELSEELAMWAEENENAAVDASAEAQERLEGASDERELFKEESESSTEVLDPISEETEVLDPTSEEIERIVGADGEETEAASTEEPTTLAAVDESVKATEEEIPVIDPEVINAKIEELSDLEVGPPPVVELRNESLDRIPANQPIVWENEALKFARVREKEVESVTEKSAETSETLATPVKKIVRIEGPPNLLATVEVEEAIARKVRIRDRIADLDVKLRLLSFNSASEIRSKGAELRAEKTNLETGLIGTNKKLVGAKASVKLWLDFQQRASREKNPKKLADEIAEVSESLYAKREKYTQASREYLQAVDAWQADPNNLAAASKMGLLGRALQQRRQGFEDGVVIAIAEGVETSVESVGKLGITARLFEEQLQQLSRHLGYYEGFTPLAAERKRDLRSSYLNDRKSLVSELKEIRNKVSDVQEKELLFEQASTAR